jgi:predicted GIY-YIG superfamily endonuclease
MQHVSLGTAENQAKTLCAQCKQQAADQIKEHNQGRSSWTKNWRPKSVAQEIPVLGWGTAVRKEKSLPHWTVTWQRATEI